MYMFNYPTIRLYLYCALLLPAYAIHTALCIGHTQLGNPLSRRRSSVCVCVAEEAKNRVSVSSSAVEPPTNTTTRS